MRFTAGLGLLSELRRCLCALTFTDTIEASKRAGGRSLSTGGKKFGHSGPASLSSANFGQFQGRSVLITA
jgi:hypothetical protein